MIEITTGIDLIEVNRLRKITPAIKERFLARVYTPGELEDCNSRETSLAGRFAAKEAAAKALGCGIGIISWQDVEIRLDQRGKPVLNLYGRALEIARGQAWISWSVSISHSSNYAIACVTALIERG